MREILIRKFHAYLKEVHPNLLDSLAEERAITTYLQQQVLAQEGLIDRLLMEEVASFTIEEIVIEQLAVLLASSEFHWVRQIIEEEFEEIAERLGRYNLLVMEVKNITTLCEPVFNTLSSFEDDHQLRLTITGIVSDYFSGERSGDGL